MWSILAVVIGAAIVVVLALVAVSRANGVAGAAESMNTEVASPADTAARAQAVVHVGTATVHADVANTPALREQGLSGRAALAPDTGMWFVFDKPDFYTFWMPDMHFAIDMVWFDAGLRVVYVQPDATPGSYPKTFAPTAPAQYVLEVPAGYATAHGIAPGAQATVAYQ